MNLVMAMRVIGLEAPRARAVCRIYVRPGRWSTIVFAFRGFLDAVTSRVYYQIISAALESKARSRFEASERVIIFE